RQIPLDRFIYALGIRQIGQATAKLLAKHYTSLENWRIEMQKAAESKESEAYQSLINIDQIGPDVAGELLEFFKEAHNQEILQQLAETLTIDPFIDTAKTDTPIAGKTVVFTGTLEKMGR